LGIPPSQEVSSEDEWDDAPLPDDSFPSRDPTALTIDIPLAPLEQTNRTNGRRSIVRLGFISRETVHDRWNVDFFATQAADSSTRVLTIASTETDLLDEGDMVRSVNGIQIGSSQLDTLQKLLTFLSQEIEVFLEVRRFYTTSYSLWS